MSKLALEECWQGERISHQKVVKTMQDLTGCNTSKIFVRNFSGSAKRQIQQDTTRYNQILPDKNRYNQIRTNK